MTNDSLDYELQKRQSVPRSVPKVSDSDHLQVANYSLVGCCAIVCCGVSWLICSRTHDGMCYSSTVPVGAERSLVAHLPWAHTRPI